MIVIPAIDLKGGKCVRLKQGLAENETVYSNEPVAMAKKWVKLGAERLHIVDLDGAFSGRPVNLEHVLNIKKETGAFIQLGGGFRTLDVIDAVLSKGIDRIILGTMVYETAGEAKVALEKYPGRFMVALDSKDGMVAIKGWKDVAEIPIDEALVVIEKIGCQEIVYTDTARDGMLIGVNLEGVKSVMAKTKMKVIASGGISSLEDLKNLKEIGTPACVVGKALYDGRLDLKKAIKTAQ